MGIAADFPTFYSVGIFVAHCGNHDFHQPVYVESKISPLFSAYMAILDGPRGCLIGKDLYSKRGALPIFGDKKPTRLSGWNLVTIVIARWFISPIYGTYNLYLYRFIYIYGVINPFTMYQQDIPSVHLEICLVLLG